MYDNLDDLVNGFCYHCRNKNVNSGATVEKQIRDAYQCVFKNNVMGGYIMLQGALTTLQSEGGCQKCVDTLQNLMSMFKA